MKTWFTADLHFNHTNILKYTKRPWATVEEMNKGLVERWNSVVGRNDRVYILGDVALGNKKDAVNWVKQLYGIKHLVFGNHDEGLRKDEDFLGCFEWAKDLAEIKIEGQRIVLCHFALKVWHQSHRGAYSLYGHSHGTMPDDPTSLSLDVGVDAWDCYPVSFEVIKARMALKTWAPVDHHQPSTQ